MEDIVHSEMSRGLRKRAWAIAAVSLLILAGAAQEAGAQGDEPNEAALAAHQGQAAEGGGLGVLAAVGAGLAIGLAALATGLAQAHIGAAGVGAIAENPKRLGAVIMLVAIPETVAILGFVIAYLIIS